MTSYDHIHRIQEDYQDASAYVGEIQGTLEYLRDAIRRRIEADQTDVKQKISDLEEKLTDESLSEPVSHLMQVELTKLKETVFSPSAAEREAYLAEIESLRAAETDLRNLEYDFTEAVARLEAEISEMKTKMSDDSTLTDLSSIIAAEERTFEHLCEEVHLAWTKSETA